MFKKLDAFRVYLIFSGAQALIFAVIFTLDLVYHVETVGLNPLQLVLVGTALEVTAFVFEVPTGVVADLVSRRLSVIIGTVLTGVGFIIEGAVPVFAAILLAQLFWGIGATFISGAADAWIADEVGEERAGRAFVRGAQIGQLLGLVGIGISVLLGRAALNIPVLAGGFAFLGLAVFLAVFMPEDGFKPAPRAARLAWADVTGPFVAGLRLVRGRPVLLMILVISLCFGAYSESFDRLRVAHFLEFNLPPLGGGFEVVGWFGLISAVGSLLAFAGTEFVQRRLDLASSRAASRALLGLYALVMLGTLGFGLAGNFGLALVTYLVAVMARGVSNPIYTAWLNRHTESSVRATVFSMSAQANALGQIAGGPVLGGVGTAFSLRAALSLGGLLLAPALVLLNRASRRVEEGRTADPAVVEGEAAK